MPAIAAIAGIAGSIIGGALQSRGASSAGNTIAHWGEAAGDSMTNTTKDVVQGVSTATSSAQDYMGTGLSQGNNALAQTFAGQAQNLNPYLQTGTNAANLMNNALAPGGGLATTFTAPTAVDVQKTPGFQFQLQQGSQAAQRAAAASGTLSSGGTAKALMQYGQGLAGTYYQNAFSNALTGYQTNYNNLLGSLNAGVNTGLQGSSQFNQAAMNFGNGVNTNSMNAAQYMGNVGMQGALGGGQLDLSGENLANQFYMQGAQGKAAGQAGSMNAWAGAATGATGGAGSALGSIFGGK